MNHLISFRRLKSSHEKVVEELCKRQTKAFEARAKFLLNIIRKELPCVNRLAACNGDFWLYGKYEDEKITNIEYIVGSDSIGGYKPKGTIYEDNLIHALAHFDGLMDKPNVTKVTYMAMKELHELAAYCEETRFHTTTSIDVVA